MKHTLTHYHINIIENIHEIHFYFSQSRIELIYQISHFKNISSLGPTQVGPKLHPKQLGSSLTPFETILAKELSLCRVDNFSQFLLKEN
jgi:hypothetical protein